MEKIAIVIHGGAGTITKPLAVEKEIQYHEVLKQSLLTGYQLLKNGKCSLDAVEASVKILEDSPLFNAGCGAVFTDKETIEMDASIMDGSTLMAGAVAGITSIKNPISLARLVMEKTPHVMLIGDSAEKFGEQNGLPKLPYEYFATQTRLEQMKKAQLSNEVVLDHSDNTHNSSHGTVGAVARDIYGNLASATSTGGMANKMSGRVGDTAIIGAGTYADNKLCAISCTGHGEYIIRANLAFRIAALMEYQGLSLDDACRMGIFQYLAHLNGNGGVIGVDSHGNISLHYNTQGMYRGYINENGMYKTMIFDEKK